MSSLEMSSPGRQSPEAEPSSDGVQREGYNATGDIRRLVSYHNEEAGPVNSSNLKSRLNKGLNWAALKKNGGVKPVRPSHDTHWQLATALNNIGVLLHESEQHENALQHYQEAVQVRMDALRTEMSDATGFQGEVLATKRAQAEKTEMALQVRQSSQAQHEPHRPLDLFPGENDDFGPVNVSKPFPIAKRERLAPMPGGPSSSPADNRDSAITLYNMGLLYYTTGNIDSAKKLFGMAQSILPASSSPALSAILLNNVALVHFHEDKSQDAIQCLVEALRLQQQVAATGSQHNQGLSALNLEETIIFTLSLMGRIYYEEGECEQALEVLKECLRLRRGSLGDDHIDVAVTLHNIGLVLHQLGDVNGAVEHCEWFAEQARRSAEPRHREHVAAALHTLGTLHLENRSVTKARTVFVECLSIRRNLLDQPSGRVDAARTLFDFGRLLQDQGSYVEALEHLREAHRLYRTVEGAEEEVAAVLCKVGQIHQERGDLDAALDVYEDVLSSSRQLFGDRNEFVASMLNVIGNVYLEMGETEDAVANFADAKRIMDLLGGSQDDGQQQPQSPVVMPNPLQFLGSDFHPCAAAA